MVERCRLLRAPEANGVLWALAELSSRPPSPERLRCFFPRREPRELDLVYSQMSWLAIQRSQPSFSPLHFNYKGC